MPTLFRAGGIEWWARGARAARSRGPVALPTPPIFARNDAFGWIPIFAKSAKCKARNQPEPNDTDATPIASQFPRWSTTPRMGRPAARAASMYSTPSTAILPARHKRSSTLNSALVRATDRQSRDIVASIDAGSDCSGRICFKFSRARASSSAYLRDAFFAMTAPKPEQASIGKTLSASWTRYLGT